MFTHYNGPTDYLTGLCAGMCVLEPGSSPHPPHQHPEEEFMSDDEGVTWPIARVVHEGPSAYSSLAALPDGTIGLLFEQGDRAPYERITFARFGLEWLTKGKDK